ncbi:MAG: hypothetical protein NZM35_06345 [Chitinophagales bacterium]|nr:hypothetical protein [Chitinophagales bacterium]
MKRFWLIVRKVLLALICACVVVLFGITLASAIDKKTQERCQAIHIKIDTESGLAFINEDEIRERINLLSGGNVVGKQISDIDLRTLEKEIRKNPYVKNAEVYVDRLQHLWVQIIQKRPIIRVMNKDGVGYYISELNDRMPLSDKFTLRLIIALGNVQINEHRRDSIVQNVLFDLVNYIRRDVFLHALVDQIEVVHEDDINLIPRSSGHVIYFGNPRENMAEKFERLKTFYREGLTRVGWYRYKSINLKYRGQVVCERSDTTTVPVGEASPLAPQ